MSTTSASGSTSVVHPPPLSPTLECMCFVPLAVPAFLQAPLCCSVLRVFCATICPASLPTFFFETEQEGFAQVWSRTMLNCSRKGLHPSVGTSLCVTLSSSRRQVHPKKELRRLTLCLESECFPSRLGVHQVPSELRTNVGLSVGFSEVT